MRNEELRERREERGGERVSGRAPTTPRLRPVAARPAEHAPIDVEIAARRRVDRETGGMIAACEGARRVERFVQRCRERIRLARRDNVRRVGAGDERAHVSHVHAHDREVHRQRLLDNGRRSLAVRREEERVARGIEPRHLGVGPLGSAEEERLHVGALGGDAIDDRAEEIEALLAPLGRRGEQYVSSRRVEAEARARRSAVAGSEVREVDSRRKDLRIGSPNPRAHRLVHHDDGAIALDVRARPAKLARIVDVAPVERDDTRPRKECARAGEEAVVRVDRIVAGRGAGEHPHRRGEVRALVPPRIDEEEIDGDAGIRRADSVDRVAHEDAEARRVRSRVHVGEREDLHWGGRGGGGERRGR